MSSYNKEWLSTIFVSAGHIGQWLKSFDWTDTLLGPIESWPQSLQSALGICLNSNFPIAIYWGPDLVLIYNDAWSPIPGNKHPWALGKPAIEVWPEIWEDIEPQFQKAFAGIPGGSKDALLPMQRHGYTEECYFDFTFTPIYGESGKVEGIFNAVIETTYRMINERRSHVLQRLADKINTAGSREKVFKSATEILKAAQEDVAFHYIYEFDAMEQPVRRAGSEPIENTNRPWPVSEVLNGMTVHLENVGEYFREVPKGYWPELPNEALLIPLKGVDGHIFGCIVGGLSSRRKYDKEYKAFFESMSNIIGGALNTITSLNQERERAEALSEIDKAKTIFFSNISHEFRTPLTLMLGPLGSIMDSDKNLTEPQRQNLQASYRNATRLQKLVNTLLDFSRIEAGRMDANFELVDIGELTSDLASSFRSAIERVGITYNVKVQNVNDPVSVDVEMWEKIVLNLISNAIKYTEDGTIQVELAGGTEEIELRVSDTGVGIRKEEQAKIFERFYRVNNMEGRSHEGTGIGLSMVKELVHLHGGAIKVESEFGRGSTFTVTIPVLNRQQPAERTVSRLGQASSVKNPFIEDVIKWTNNTNVVSQGEAASHKDTAVARPRVLLADDNSDMREYIQRLLEDDFETRAVTNGQDAFRIALEWTPDLIISDIMMPKLDGFGLLKLIRSNLVTRNIPVVFLSARVGDEQKVDGITAGADDYLIKPFSSKELIARVNNHIIISRTRRKAEKEFFNLFMQSPAQIHVMKGPEHIVEFFHPLAKKFLAGRDITGMKIRDALPEVEGQGYFEMLDQVYHHGKSFFLPESKAFLKNSDGKLEEYFFNITYMPWRNLEGEIQGVLQFSFDVTQQAVANQKIKESEERFRLLATSIPQIIWIADAKGKIEYLSDQWEKYTGQKATEGISKFSSLIHPEDIEGVRTKWFKAMEEGQPWQSEFRLRDVNNNSYTWFSGYTLPLKDESGNVIKWIGSSSDISSQKQLNETLSTLVAERTAELNQLNEILGVKNQELLQTYNFLQTVLNSSVELVTAFDTNLNYTFVNQRVKDITDKNPEELIGKHVLDVNPGFEKTDGYEFLLRALQGETIHVESRRPYIDNEMILETFVMPLKTNGEINGILTLQRDITAIVKLTDDLKKSNHELRRSNEDLQQFAHVTSHDLKEPVRKIKIFADLLKSNYDNLLPDKGKSYLQKIESATDRIASMIDSVLRYASVDAMQDGFESLDMAGIFRNIVEDFEVVIREKNATVEIGSMPSLTGSAPLIYQLFYNLLNNALKFTQPDNEPVIRVNSTFVTRDDIPDEHQGSDSSQRYIRIDVADNGIGFDQAYAEKIFESFLRLHSKDKFEGTGLGLSLCQKIVDRHHGYIKAFGSPGVGATFSVYLPAPN